MSDTNLERTRQIIVKWWEGEDVPEEELRARVVLIYKKCDTNKLDNYKPIFLLKHAIQDICSNPTKKNRQLLNKDLQSTQYGFREDNSTGDAVHVF